MEPIRKDFTSHTLFPFHINYQDQKLPDNELPTHFHDWYEIVYVYSGEGRFFINNTFFDMAAGDLFALPGNTIHHTIPNKENPVTSTAIFFHPFLVQDRFLHDSSFTFLQLFDESTRLCNYRYTLEHDQQKEVSNYLKDIHDEISKEKSGYKQAALLHLKMMLLLLNRSILHHQNTEVTKSPTPKWLNDVLSYIEDNFTDDSSLNSLAEYAGVSSSHLSRVFKHMTGLNITEYIVTKKILMAKDLLLKTNENVGVIADTCGFESLPYFHRTFKKHIGMTPANFRKTENYFLLSE